jgi:hypothetical protein
MDAARRKTFLVTVRDAGSDSDGDVILRLRAWLKSGLRAHRLRCTSIAEDKERSISIPDEPSAYHQET